ncbi:hypothetical protein GGI20_004629 [Coemansia sp. BCRC 34301]|nr:hypothetical protein GGI20_004629 [Coemansia sp. BCRC 34301]
MLDSLPPRVITLIVQYLRSTDNNQTDALPFSQTSRTLRHHSQPIVWEYFTLSRLIKSTREYFPQIQRFVSRLQLANNEPGLGTDDWLEGLAYAGTLDWSFVRMTSVELEGFEGVVARRVVGFAHMLDHVQELWVTLSDDPEIVRMMLGREYHRVEELRLVGKSGIAQHPLLPIHKEYRDLGAISLDAKAALMTDAVELVARSRTTLRELNVEEYTNALANGLRLHPQSPYTQFPSLRQLAISSTGDLDAVLDGVRMPALEMLYFRDTTYPCTPEGNAVLESHAVRLMRTPWPRLRLLVVDSMTRGDLGVLSSMAPSLELLRIGLLGSDVDVVALEGGPPCPAIDLAGVIRILDSCDRLVDLSIETPDAFEDAYNNHDAIDPQTAWFERPSNPPFGISLENGSQGTLRSLSLNAWALTFDQLLSLFGLLPALTSFEGNLKFNASYPCRSAERGGVVHLSLVHSTRSRHRRVFTSNLLRFVSMLPLLRTLELYGSSSVPGIESAVSRVLPGCVTSFCALNKNTI